MPARKGQNNFKVHQEAKVERHLGVILGHLGAIHRGQTFADEKSLVRYVAERSGLHRSTVARNPVYRKAVLDFLARRPGVVAPASDDVADKAALRARSISADIEAAQLRRENRRLREALKARQRPPAAEAGRASGADAPGDADRWRDAFAQTAALLATVLDRLASKEVGIVLDPGTGQILDQAEVGGDRIVAAPPRTSAFLDWLARHAEAYGPAAIGGRGR